jgi:uncharacterized protein YeaC (DUF1315 family)
MKIRPVGVELFHADRQADMKLVVAFRSSANAPKKKRVCYFRGKICHKAIILKRRRDLKRLAAGYVVLCSL